MGIVVDVVLASFSFHIRVDQKKNPKDKSRQAKYGKKTNISHGHDYNAGKDSSGGAAGRSQRAVMAIVLVFFVGRDICNDDPQEVKSHKQRTSCHRSKTVTEKHLHHATEEVEGKHVEQQMHVVFVDEAGQDKTIPLAAVFDSIGHKHPSIHHLRTVESQDTRDRGDPDYERSQCQFHGLLFPVNQAFGK